MRLKNQDFRFIFLIVLIFPFISPSTRIANNSTVHELTINPLSAQPSNISAYYIDISLMNESDKLSAYTIQGLVNRNGPILFIIDLPSDGYWRSVLENYSVSFTQIPNLSALITQFREYINGVVVYDYEISDSINMANSISGILNATIAHNTRAIELNLTQNLPILFNCTEIIQQYSLHTKFDRYNWTFYQYKNLWNTTALSMIPADRDWRIIMNNRDYITKHRLFAFPEIHFGHNDGIYNKPRENELVTLFEQIVRLYPRGTKIYGFPFPTGGNEGECVSIITKAGHYLIASGYIMSASFHEMLSVSEPFKQNYRPERFENSSIENKVYVSFVVSDGDNVGYLQSYFVDYYLKDPLRGSVPLAYTISGQLADSFPYVLKHFYDSMTPNDFFVMASGVGYAYPDKMDSETFRMFTSRTKRAMEISDLDILWLLGADKQRTLTQFAARTGGTAIYSGFWGFSSGIREGYLSSNTLIVPITKGGLQNSSQIIDFIEQVKVSNPNRPIFLALYLDTWATYTTGSIYSTLSTVISHFNTNEVEILRLDDFSYRYTQYLKGKMFSGWGAGLLWASFGIIGIGLWILLKEEL